MWLVHCFLHGRVLAQVVVFWLSTVVIDKRADSNAEKYRYQGDQPPEQCVHDFSLSFRSPCQLCLKIRALDFNASIMA
jgi:hypothetical protein